VTEVEDKKSNRRAHRAGTARLKRDYGHQHKLKDLRIGWARGGTMSREDEDIEKAVEFVGASENSIGIGGDGHVHYMDHFYMHHTSNNAVPQELVTAVTRASVAKIPGMTDSFGGMTGTVNLCGKVWFAVVHKTKRDEDNRGEDNSARYFANLDNSREELWLVGLDGVKCLEGSQEKVTMSEEKLDIFEQLSRNNIDETTADGFNPNDVKPTYAQEERAAQHWRIELIPPVFEKNDVIEVMEKKQWLKATVSKVNGTESYSVVVDGEKKEDKKEPKKVKASSMRKIDGARCWVRQTDRQQEYVMVARKGEKKLSGTEVIDDVEIARKKVTGALANDEVGVDETTQFVCDEGLVNFLNWNDEGTAKSFAEGSVTPSFKKRYDWRQRDQGSDDAGGWEKLDEAVSKELEDRHVHERERAPFMVAKKKYELNDENREAMTLTALTEGNKKFDVERMEVQEKPLPVLKVVFFDHRTYYDWTGLRQYVSSDPEIPFAERPSHTRELVPMFADADSKETNTSGGDDGNDSDDDKPPTSIYAFNEGNVIGLAIRVEKGLESGPDAEAVYDRSFYFAVNGEWQKIDATKHEGAKRLGCVGWVASSTLTLTHPSFVLARRNGSSLHAQRADANVPGDLGHQLRK
jgi:hypothetical protein